MEEIGRGLDDTGFFDSTDVTNPDLEYFRLEALELNELELDYTQVDTMSPPENTPLIDIVSGETKAPVDKWVLEFRLKFAKR